MNRLVNISNETFVYKKRKIVNSYEKSDVRSFTFVKTNLSA
jgi:hypothetical protein